MKLFTFLTSLLWLVTASAQPVVVATGLQAPQKMIVGPGGNLLVAETSGSPNSGRVSLVTRDGVRRTLLEALPSATDVTGGTSGPTALAWRERTLYVGFGGGDIERRTEVPGRTVHNPQGSSSPLFATVLVLQFSQSIDAIAGSFRMTTDMQQSLYDGNQVDMNDGAGTTAQVNVLARFPQSETDPNVVYRFSNIWGMALSEDGRTLWVTDASMNALFRVDTANGRWQRVTRFSAVANPASAGPRQLDSVPTGVRVYGSQVLVSFLTGAPFVPGLSRVLAVNPDARTTEPFIFGVTSAVDVLWRTLPDGRSQFYVLEFSQNQSAQPPAPGRLLRYDSPAPQVVAADLQAPVSLAYDESSGQMYVLEIGGRILRFQLN